VANFVDRLAARLKVRKPFLYAGAGVIGIGILSLFRARSRASAASTPFALPSFASQEKVTRAEAGSDGFVSIPPKNLAAQAGVGSDIYTLARFLGSEHARGNPKERASIAWAIVNTAKKREVSLLKLATVVRTSGVSTDTGLYGKQEMPQGNRYASTARDPSKADIYIASQVLAGTWPDPTGGADQFVDPKTQRSLVISKPNRYLPLDTLLRGPRSDGSWGWTMSSGSKQVKEVVVVDGTDANELWMVRKIVPGGVPGTRVVPAPYA
jgi:hypothetical protein